MKLKTISTLCFAASTMLVASSAMAWENGDHSTSASVALTSDYVWRGASQTLEDAAISGSFDYSHASGFTAGVWASNVDFTDDAPDDGADIEIDIYASFGGELDNGIGWDVGYLRYIFPGTTAGNDYDWNEYHVSASYSYFSAAVNYSDDYLAGGNDGLYYTLGFDYELPQGFALSAGVGFTDVDEAGADSYTDYNVGISKELAGFGFDARYYDTDNDAQDFYGSDTDDLLEGRVVFTISKSM